MFDEIDKTNKRLTELDQLVIDNAIQTLKLIDMQKRLLQELKDQTDDKRILDQIDAQLSHLISNRIMVHLLTKVLIKYKLTTEERRIFLKHFKKS
ncbi:peptidase M23 [Paenibacillus sp. ATY16]|uniref:peptidase M23 n=1 Tax=Paenibacillus sp. ATY16 TaxID=1759312 RepID=UPI00200DD265|nr:peptidase M23 [Paenibacillus sp. ATY16]MCK9858197.1 peptidase M23 [Paenibacillus sp. ATY16]